MSENNKYPIILAHGIARFDFLVEYFIKNFAVFGLSPSAMNDGLHYFKGIARHLRNHGFDVYHTSVSFAAGVERRAADLRDEVNKVLQLKGADKVHIIAHSMGGLDARHMIVRLDMAGKVASLTTIGTPHLGTSFADWKLARGGDQLIEVLGRVLDLAGFQDLTTTACREFNDEAQRAEAANPVVYQTYASAEAHSLIFAPLQLPWAVINEHEGANDGLVSLTSQSWQKELAGDGGVKKAITQRSFPVAADHLNQIGWWDLNELKKVEWWRPDKFNAVAQYERSIKDAYLEIARGLGVQVM